MLGTTECDVRHIIEKKFRRVQSLQFPPAPHLLMRIVRAARAANHQKTARFPSAGTRVQSLQPSGSSSAAD